MRKIFCILSCLLVAGCTSFDRNPYDGALRELRVTAVYPEGYAGYLREGVAVKLSDRNTGNVYTALTDAQGHAGFRVAAGHYRLSVLDLPDDSAVFNGTIEQVDLVGGDKDVDVALKFSKPGTILIKEIYSGGCMQDPPATGTYADDKYIVLHNNSFETYYLDGLCLAMVAPYNSNANNPWTSTDPSGISFSAITPPSPIVSGCSRDRGRIFRWNPARMPWWPTTASIIRRPIPSR